MQLSGAERVIALPVYKILQTSCIVALFKVGALKLKLSCCTQPGCQAFKGRQGTAGLVRYVRHSRQSFGVSGGQGCTVPPLVTVPISNRAGTSSIMLLSGYWLIISSRTNRGASGRADRYLSDPDLPIADLVWPD